MSTSQTDSDGTLQMVERMLKAVAGNPQAMGLLMVMGGFFVKTTRIQAHERKVWVPSGVSQNAPPDLRLAGSWITVKVPESPGLDIVVFRFDPLKAVTDIGQGIAPWFSGVAHFLNSLGVSELGQRLFPYVAPFVKAVQPTEPISTEIDVTLGDLLTLAGITTLIGPSLPGLLKGL